MATDEERMAIKKSFSQEFQDTSIEKPLMPPQPNWFQQKVPKRYVLAVMALLGFCNIYALRVNLSVAIVAMVSNKTVEGHNNTVTTEPPDFDWDSKLQGLILGSFFYGYIVTQLPGGWLAGKVGAKHLYGGGVAATAVFSLVTPPMARLNVYLLVALRILEGFAEGVTYPAIFGLWSKWAPPFERSMLATVGFSGSYIGTVLSMPISGAIADTAGWPWVFYVHGVIALLWFVVWCFVVAESPDQHSNITKHELEYINQAIGFSESQTKGREVPWKDMFLSLPTWAIIVAHFTANWGFYTLLTELPSFLRDAMQFDLFKAGFVGGLPYLAMAVVLVLGGMLADFLRVRSYLSTTVTRKIFTTGGFLCQTVFMIIAAYVMSAVAAVTCLIIAVGLGGFPWAGFAVNHLDIAPQFASVLMGISNTMATIPGIVSPTITGQIVVHGAAAEWRIIFYIAAAIYFAGAVFYALFASGEKQKWAEIPSGYEAHVDMAESHQDQQLAGDK